MGLEARKLALVKELLAIESEERLNEIELVIVKTSKNNIPEWQQELVNKRIASVKNGEMKTRNWEEARKDMFPKL